MSSISRVIVQGLGEQVSYLKVEGRIGLASGDKWKKKKRCKPYSRRIGSSFLYYHVLSYSTL
jgi:hypothetical protein